jgi:F-type H+-transporting ATPase subunit beta
MADTLSGCRAILDGKADAIPEEALYMIGRLEEAHERDKAAAGASP